MDSKDLVASVPTPRIQSFWKWLASQIDKIKASYLLEDSDQLQRILGQRVEKLHPRLKWEIGPTPDGFFFALSPNGDRTLLGLTKHIVSMSPDVPNWRFLHAKPEKSWNRAFSMALADSTSVDLDCSAWTYRITWYPKGKFGDLVFLIPETSVFPENSLDSILQYLLESELGEELFLEHVGDTEYVLSSIDQSVSSDPISTLRDHILYLLQNYP